MLHEENEESEVKKRFIDSFKGLWSTLTTQVKLFIKLIPCVPQIARSIHNEVVGRKVISSLNFPLINDSKDII